MMSCFIDVTKVRSEVRLNTQVLFFAFIPLIHKHFHDLAQIFIGLSTYNGTQWPATKIFYDNN